jgi:hypothetical protein
MIAIAFVPHNDIINMCGNEEAYYKRKKYENEMCKLFFGQKEPLQCMQ